MDKSLLILSTSLLTILANAEEAGLPSANKTTSETANLISANDSEKEQSHVHSVKARLKKDDNSSNKAELSLEQKSATTQVQETPSAKATVQNQSAQTQDVTRADSQTQAAVQDANKSAVQNQPAQAQVVNQADSPVQAKDASVKAAPVEKLATDTPAVKQPAKSEEKKSAVAQTQSPTENRSVAQEKRIRDLEMKVSELQKEVHHTANPFCTHPDQSFYVMGEWLYWKFTEGGTEFAVTHTPIAEPTDSTFPSLPNAKVQSLHFDWRSGFRVGAGYHFVDKGWDVSGSYSQISSHAKSSAHGAVFPLLDYQDSNPVLQATSARAKWDIKFKVIDFEIGRLYSIAPSLNIQPHFGLKAAMINQGAHVNYSNNDPLFFGIPVGKTFTLREKNDFRGIGLRTGLHSMWEMGGGFSFYGTGAVSLLVSQIKTKQVQDQFVSSLGGPVVAVQGIDMKSKFFPLLPVAELKFGLDWGQTFSKDRFRIGFNVGVEGQYWWKQNYLEHFVGVSASVPVYVRPTEDLGIYGLSIGGRFDF